jgi:NACalpha-BTF3-like transcription factor
MRDSSVYVVNVVLSEGMKAEEEQRMDTWLRMRLGRDDVQVVVSRDGVVRETAKK